MLTKTSFGYFILSVLSASVSVFGREAWLERDNRPVYLYPRRFGQEQPAVLQKIGAACPGQVCGNLAGQAVTPLLAGQPECSQQDLADAIIDASKQFDTATQANMLALAIEYRQVEKNTPPDFTTNPPSLRNSVFCQKAPKNPELSGLVQAQDPANNPDLFFDPATKATVRKGTQANTSPFGDAAPLPADPVTINAPAVTATVTTSSVVQMGTALHVEVAPVSCVTAITVTVSAPGPTATATDAVTVTVGNGATATVSPGPSPTVMPGVDDIGDLGSCTVPQIQFAVGFDGRKETSFEPVDKGSFNHGSAQNINIITQFICDTLTNACGADQTAKDTCATARAAAAAAPANTGAQADAFNAAFGIDTQFVDVPAVDNQGRIVPGTGSNSDGNGQPNSFVASPTSGATPPAASSTSGNSEGNFGSCTVPEIEFGAGFDGRRETSFRPTDQQSYNHGSAQNIDTITQSVCDSLTNTCGADQTAKDTCATARAAASAASVGTGAQADAFNAVFGITTNFANVAVVDNQGNVAGAASSSTTPVPSRVTAPPVVTSPNDAPPSTSTETSGTGSTPAPGSNNIQSFSGSLGGVSAPVVTDLGNGQFQVEGNSVFNNRRNALVRSCDVQSNQCADAANASGNQNGFTVASCTEQQRQCTTSAQ